MMVRPKHQRLMLAIIALLALAGAAMLAMWGLSDRAAGKGRDGAAIRLGGMVEKGSLVREADGVSIRFVVSDLKAKTQVTYRGITPDLFREGSGVVAEGRMRGGTFVADTILAKHDERYMPPQMAGTKPAQ